MLRAAIRKDMLLLFRDRGAVASLFLLPIIFVAFFGSMFSGGSGDGGDEGEQPAAVVAVHEDGEGPAEAPGPREGDAPQVPDTREGVSGFQLAVPGNAVLFGFFLALTMALSFVEERKSGTWRRLLAAPVRRPVLLCSKLVPFLVVGLIQMTFLFGVGIIAFGMDVGTSVAGLVLLTAAVVFCATALGLFIASFGGTEKQVGAVGSICLLILGLVGGAMMPRMVMPETMQQLGLFTPHAWALEGYYDLLIREGTGLRDALVPTAAVTAFGAVFATIGAARFRFER